MASGNRFPRLALKLRTLFRGEQVDRELDEEIRYHVERKTEQLIARGVAPADARYQALRAFGGVELRKEICRDARGPWATIWIERLLQDVRHGTRTLIKSPGFTAIAVLSIAVGVGANVAMFSIADGLILRPLPVPDPGGLVVIGTTTPAGGVRYGGLSYPDYTDLRERVRSFEGLAATRIVLAGLTHRQGEIARGSMGTAVSANYFDVLRVKPVLGRTFVPGEERATGDAAAVVVLSHRTWSERFGADPGIVGSAIRVAGIPFTVIGVAPERFEGTTVFLPSGFYIPMGAVPMIDARVPRDFLDRRGDGGLDAVGRLVPTATIERASAEAALVAAALERQYPETNRRLGMLVSFEPDARATEYFYLRVLALMLVLLAVAVLLVACANVAGLLTSRAPARSREIAVRIAVGGGRTRLIRQLMTECVLIAVAGGALGFALGYGGIRSFRAFQVVSNVGVALTFTLDRRALLVGLVVAGLSALLAGAIPAWRSTRIRDLSGTLRNTAAPDRTSRLWGRHSLVAIQMALTLVLLTVALSMYRSFETMYAAGPGFRTDHLLLTAIDPGLAHYDDAEAGDFYERLRERAAAIPGVVSATFTSFVPMSQDGVRRAPIVPEGFELPPEVDRMPVDFARVGEDYFDTLDIDVIEGRGFAATDTVGTPRVAVVSQGMATLYWPGQSALGRRVRILDPGPQWVEVVGVVEDIKFRLFTPASTPFLYVPLRQFPSGAATLVVQTRDDPVASADAVRAAIVDTDRDVPIFGLYSIEAFYDTNTRNMNRVIVRTVGAMGVTGLALALGGLYGLTAFTVSRRTREIGIRMAMGGRPASVLGMVLRQGSWPSFCGVAAGIAASAAVGAVIQRTFLSTSTDIVTFAIIVPMVVGVALLAAYVPARRAALIDPLTALRQD